MGRRSYSRDRRRDRSRERRERSRSRDRNYRPRSRDRNDRDRSLERQRPEAAPKRRILLNKWDEGVGGIYVPPAASAPSSFGSSSLVSAPAQRSAAPLSAIGDPSSRKLVISGVAKHFQGADISGFVSSSLQSLLPAGSPIGVDSVVGVQLLSLSGGFRSALLELRTPVAAALLVKKLNGEIWEGSKVFLRRPTGFEKSEPELTQEDLEGEGGIGILGDAVEGNSRSLPTLPANPDYPISPRLRITGFPVYLRPENVRDILEQFGPISIFSYPRDTISGRLRQEGGVCQFFDSLDSAACVAVVDGWVLGGSVVRIERISNEQINVKNPERVVPSLAGPSSGPLALKDDAASLPVTPALSISARIAANPALSAQLAASREIGARPSTVVQLLNAVYPEDLISDTDYLQILEEVKSEAAKWGIIESVRAPRPASDLSAPPGCGKIFVQFKDLTSARKFQYDMNGRLFDGSRVVCAGFYPIDRFLQGKLVLHG